MTELPTLDPKREALRRHVLEHSLKTGNFTLKSGRASTWFLDTKQTACRPDGIQLVADVALDVIGAVAPTLVTVLPAPMPRRRRHRPA